MTVDYQWMARDSLLTFAPHEVKRMAFDVGPAAGVIFPLGTYAVRGLYSLDTTAAIALQVVP